MFVKIIRSPVNFHSDKMCQQRSSLFNHFLVLLLGCGFLLNLGAKRWKDLILDKCDFFIFLTSFLLYPPVSLQEFAVSGIRMMLSIV